MQHGPGGLPGIPPGPPARSFLGTQGTEGTGEPGSTPAASERSPEDAENEVGRYNTKTHSFKTKVFQLYRHTDRWWRDPDYRSKCAGAGKVTLRHRPVRDEGWSGADRDRRSIDVKLPRQIS